MNHAQRADAVSGGSRSPEDAAPSAIAVDGVAPGPCAPGMARKEPYRDVLAGVPGATPSTAVALGADDGVVAAGAGGPGAVNEVEGVGL